VQTTELTMRLVVVHSSKTVTGLRDAYHRHLFFKQLSVVFEEYADVCPHMGTVEALPRGCAVGLALLDCAEWFDPAKHGPDPWVRRLARQRGHRGGQALGPFCYHVRRACRFARPIACAGALGFFRLPSEVWDAARADVTGRAALVEWRAVFGDAVRWECPRGLSVRQPFGRALVTGYKTVENRGSSMGSVFPGGRDARAAPPPPHGGGRCRFCPPRGPDACMCGLHRGHEPAHAACMAVCANKALAALCAT